MKPLDRYFILLSSSLLILSCLQVCWAKSPPSPPPPPPSYPSVSITISGAASSSIVCKDDPFTAIANVSNISTSGLVYEWSVAIGFVNGQSIFRTTSNTVTATIARPFSETRAHITLRVFKNGRVVTDRVKLLTVLSAPPAKPGFISVVPSNPNAPTETVICQNSGATFSVAAVTGASQYLWTANGNTTTTSSPSFSAFFNTLGAQTVSVRAQGCEGTSASTSVSVFVIPANQSPCSSNQFSRTASSSNKLSVGIYPNPVNDGALKIDVSQDYLLSSVQLVDQETGKTVKSFTITDRESIVATNDLPEGTYLFRLRNKESTLTRRIVIE